MATVPPSPDNSAPDIGDPDSDLPRGSEAAPGLSSAPDPSAADAGGSQAARTRATESVIDRFGGIRPMAGKLDIPVTTVQGWKKRGHIPATRRPDIVAAAASHALVLDAVELDIALADLPGDDALPDSITDHLADSVADPPPLAEDAVDRAAATPADPPAPPVANPTADPVAAPAPATSAGTDKRKADRPARPSAPPEPQPKRRGGGFAFLAFLFSTVTAAAVVTDILRPGLLGSVAADLPGIGTVMAPPPPDPAVQAVSDRVAALEAGVASLTERPALPADLTALPDRFRTLETELYGVADRLGGLNGRLAVLEAGAGAPGGLDEATLKQELDATRASLRAELTQLLETRLGAVERPEPQTRDTAPDTAPVDGAAGIDLAPLADRLDRVEAMVTALSDRLDGLIGQVATLETAKSTSAVTGDVTGGAPALAGEALVVAANQLLGALRGGLPYADELAAVAALGTGDGELAAALEPLGARADTGLPTAATLIAGFRGLPDAIIRAERTRPDAGWLDQTLGRVAALVTVRRTDGDAAGGAVDAVVARAEAAVRRGDLAAAVTELETLEGPAAEAAAGWLADARALVAAETAAQAVSRLAVARLAAGGGAP